MYIRMHRFSIVIAALCLFALGDCNACQQLTSGDIELSWLQNYEAIQDYVAFWQFEDKVHDAYFRQSNSRNMANNPDGTATKAQSSRYWHVISSKGSDFQHRRIAAEDETIVTPPGFIIDFPARVEVMQEMNVMGKYRGEISGRFNGQYVNWNYTPKRDLHLYESLPELPAKNKMQKKGLWITTFDGMNFRLPTQQHLQISNSETKVQNLDGGLVRFELVTTTSSSGEMHFRTKASWTLDPNKALLPLEFQLEHFRTSGEDIDAESRVIVQSGKFEIASLPKGWFVKELVLDFFNYVESDKVHGEMEYVKTQSHVYRMVECLAPPSSDLDLSLQKPINAVGINSTDSKIEITQSVKDRISDIGSDKDVPFVWPVYLVAIIATGSVILLLIRVLDRRKGQS